MISDSGFISDLQVCTRKFLLNQEYHPSRWRPKNLFDKHLRKAVLRYSHHPDPKLYLDARLGFLQQCSDPGLAVSGSPYILAKEWAALLEVIVCAFPHMGIPSGLHHPPDVPFNSSISWRPSAFADPTGKLHRFITLERWDEASTNRELHSWWTAGDLAATAQPMFIHAIEIGRMVKGMRSSDWVRGWRHSSFPNFKVHFRHRDGTGFKGWTPIRFLSSRMNAEEWVEKLWTEGAGRMMLHGLEVKPPNENDRMLTIAQMMHESIRGGRLLNEENWQSQPMSRGACDGVSPCQFQNVCYGGITDIEASGLYVRRRLELTSLQEGRIPPRASEELTQLAPQVRALQVQEDPSRPAHTPS